MPAGAQMTCGGMATGRSERKRAWAEAREKGDKFFFQDFLHSFEQEGG